MAVLVVIITPTNMAALLTALGASSALGKLISAPNYSVTDSNSNITFSNMVIAGGSAVASPNENGSGYSYELECCDNGCTSVNATPSLLTSNSPNFTVSYNGGSSAEAISLESYRVNNGNNLFSDLTDPNAPVVNTTLVGDLAGLSNGSASLDIGGTITVAQAAAINSHPLH